MIDREAFFLDTPGGPRFAVVTRPKIEKPKGGWLYVHPFAEEMNKSRRMAALTAQAFAEQGWLVLQPDLKGCGDSAGDFGDATWQDWLDDLSLFWAWLEQRCDGTRGLWSLRAGCLVVTDWLEQKKASHPLLLWQPVTSGERHLTQFLRLKAVNEALNDADSGGVKQLRSDLARGAAVEVAGYQLRAGLAAGLTAARLRLHAEFRSPVALLEVASGERLQLSPASASLTAGWQEAKLPYYDEVVQGPSFWQTVEIETAPALMDASHRALERMAL